MSSALAGGRQRTTDPGAAAVGRKANGQFRLYDDSASHDDSASRSQLDSVATTTPGRSREDVQSRERSTHDAQAQRQGVAQDLLLLLLVEFAGLVDERQPMRIGGVFERTSA